MSLEKFQTLFLKSIKNPSDPWLLNSIVPAGKLDHEGAFQVYRNDYYARLSEAIGENYESVWFVLGDSDFFALTRSFIEGNASSVRDLSSYGKTFPEFIATTEYQKEFSFLSDLACFERHFWQLFHAPSTTSCDSFGELDLSTLGDSRWALPEGALLSSWDYDIPMIFSAREGKSEDFDIDFEHSSACLLVKLDERVEIFRLSASQFITLMQLDKGIRLADALSGTPAEIQELFALLKHERIPLRLRCQ